MSVKYIKGDQTYKIDDQPIHRVVIECNEVGEGLWIAQSEDHGVLLNNALHFGLYFSWGVIIPSENPVGGDKAEVIDVTALCDEHTVLTLHPEAWDSYLAEGVIDTDGNYTHEEDE